MPMWTDLNKFSDEVKLLISIVDWRRQNEPVNVQQMRNNYAEIMELLCKKRSEAGRSEVWRNLSIAITALEDSCIRAIKALYHK